jgi:hypothetical protein
MLLGAEWLMYLSQIEVTSGWSTAFVDIPLEDISPDIWLSLEEDHLELEEWSVRLWTMKSPPSMDLTFTDAFIVTVRVSRGKREFSTCRPSILGVSWTFWSSFLDVFLSPLFLDSCSWRFVLVPGVLVPDVRALDVPIGGPGGFSLSRQSEPLSGLRLSRLLRVVAGCLKGVFQEKGLCCG